jgi:hypothetical protein
LTLYSIGDDGLITGVKREKVNEILNRIKTNSFNYDDIDLLFIHLREYSEKNSIFEEISHFIAHNETRIKGLIFDSVSALNTRVKMLNDKSNEYLFSVDKPFRKELLDAIKLQVKKLEKNFIQTQFGLSKEMIEERLNEDFVIENKEKVYIKKTSQNVLDLISYCLNTIGTIPDFTQNEVIEDINKTLIKNEFSIEGIEYNSNKIMLCILVLLHRTKFKLNNQKIAYCHIYYNAEERGTVKKLGLYTKVFFSEYEGIGFGYPIISTNLVLDNWCENNLMDQLENKKTKTGLHQPLIINADFKLSSIQNPVSDSFFEEVDNMNSVCFVLKNIAPKNSKTPYIRAIINQILSK